MPTPSGVNYLLQSLLLLSNSPIIEQQESKVDVQSYVLISLSVHWHLCFAVTHYIIIFCSFQRGRSECRYLASEVPVRCPSASKSAASRAGYDTPIGLVGRRGACGGDRPRVVFRRVRAAG